MGQQENDSRDEDVCITGVEKKIENDFERCKGCGLCVENCPKDVLEISKESNKNSYFPAIVANEAACVSCTRCYIVCGDSCITVRKDQ